MTSTIGLILISNAIAGQPVQFAAMPLAEGAGAASYLWTFSDGRSAAGQQVAVTFDVAGMYSVSIATSNDRGEIAVAQIAFHVDQR